MFKTVKVPKKTLVIILSCLVALALIISVAAVLIKRSADKIEGSYSQEIVNRIDFLVKNTEFVFVKSDEVQEFEFEIDVSATKTEPDFYGVINSINFSGLAYTSCIISPADLPYAVSLPDAPLPVLDGKPQTMTWNIYVAFNAQQAMDTNATISILYSSGVKEDAVNRHALPVTIKISVIDQYPLLQKIAEAENYIEENSSEELGGLKAAISKGQSEISLASKTSQAKLDGAADKIQEELDKLL